MMARFCADPARLFPGLPYFDAFPTAAAAGLTGIELPQPYEFAASETRRALAKQALTLALVAVPPPNYTGGARGYAGTKDGSGRFQHDLRRALRYVEALAPDVIELLPGPNPVCEDTLRSNLSHAVETAPSLPFAIPVLVDAENGSEDLEHTFSFLDAFDPKQVGVIVELSANDVTKTLIQGLGSRLAMLRIIPDAKCNGRKLSKIGESCRAAGYSGWISIAGIPDGARGGADFRWLAGLDGE